MCCTRVAASERAVSLIDSVGGASKEPRLLCLALVRRSVSSLGRPVQIPVYVCERERDTPYNLLGTDTNAQGNQI